MASSSASFTLNHSISLPMRPGRLANGFFHANGASSNSSTTTIATRAVYVPDSDDASPTCRLSPFAIGEVFH